MTSVKPLDLEKLRKAVRNGTIEWRKHTLQRMAERGISQEVILSVLLSGERIRDYADDKPFASALFLGYDGNRPVHIVAAVDETVPRAFIITVYEPTLDVFESDFRTRRKQ